MTSRAGKTKLPPQLGPLIVLVLLAGGAWLVLHAQRAPTGEPGAFPTATPPSPRAPKADPPAPANDPPPEAGSLGPNQPSARGAPPPAHPHPSTAEHERLFKENGLFAAMSAAMDRRDTVTLRRTLEQYGREYPEDAHLLQTGFEVIADCIEQPGEASTAKARAYYGTHKASILRRHVRRHCFEPNAP